MQEMVDLMRSPISSYVYRNSKDTLTGHARGAAENAFSYIERAHFVAEKYPSLAYFCITHATEEAVVSLMQTARDNGYAAEIPKFRNHVHTHKAVVTYFAQQIADYLTGIGFGLAYAPDGDFISFQDSRPERPLRGVLSLETFDFHGDETLEVQSDRTMFLDELMSDPDGTILYINNLADFRNKVLYAAESRPPSITTVSLKVQLLMHTKLALGMIWAATELHRHNVTLPAVCKIMRDMNSLLKRIDRKKLRADC